MGASKERLETLCANFIARAEDYDVHPTEKQKNVVLAFLERVEHVEPPKMSTTVNAEITLLWNTTGDKYKAYIQTDGSIICLHNKSEVPPQEFLNLVSRVPA